MKRLLEILVISSLILDVLVRNFKNYFPEHFYYKAEAIMIFSITSFLFYYKRHYLTFVVFSLSINNIYDEFLGNPLELGLNELLTAIFILVYGLFKFRQ